MSDEDVDDDILAVAAEPLSASASPVHGPPWYPMLDLEPDASVRHMAAGVAVALHLLMTNHAAPGPVPRLLDERRRAPPPVLMA